MSTTVEISSLRLRRLGKTTDVLVKIGDTWHRVIREVGDGPISHFISAEAMEHSPIDLERP